VADALVNRETGWLRGSGLSEVEPCPCGSGCGGLNDRLCGRWFEHDLCWSGLSDLLSYGHARGTVESGRGAY
jgi:hypothetical protein